ncbi:COG2426 family protein [Candidatus Margulisiibacteriota bacterium]
MALVEYIGKELTVFLLAAAPIVELRGSIPLGLGLGIPIFQNYLLGVSGSILPVIPILWFLNTMTKGLRKIGLFDKFFAWLFARTRARSKLVERYEMLGLILFIAVPLPVTGVWTGCVAAYLFGLTWLETFVAATIGTSIAGLIVTLISLGVINFLH